MRRALFALLGLCLLLVGALFWSQVDNELTAEDREYLQKIMAETGLAPLSPQADAAGQLEFLIDAQRAIQQIAPVDRGLPLGLGREPRDLYTARYGLCYDRSRVFEKLVRMNGLEARHVSLFSLRDDSLAGLLFTHRLRSHAVSEVRTAAGWLLVDSNDPWVSLGRNGEPVALAEILRTRGEPPGGWHAEQPAMPVFYREPLVAIYGLYSRHGYFYPPYNALPDMNWRELLHNL